ncbi:hypothetical protein OGATHE_005315 [Ogataea polymorpha]|uniref:Histone H2A.Z-specific chaperone CHZ1 n=1 Tax=Ogataea polymorpha TaxID=460523 RepID=A0A9P8NVC4_9ASCO|nr:hypothetical protein KL908_001805 [Ogataea polymorpha]KAH3660983.1 hypothetical protein OGATHE_005315 [Ogataea polymorpha]
MSEQLQEEKPARQEEVEARTEGDKKEELSGKEEKPEEPAKRKNEDESQEKKKKRKHSRRKYDDVPPADDKDSDEEEEEEVDDDNLVAEDEEEDDLQEIDTANIITTGRRTRGRVVDYSKVSEQLSKEENTSLNDDDGEEDGDFKEPETKDQ